MATSVAGPCTGIFYASCPRLSFATTVEAARIQNGGVRLSEPIISADKHSKRPRSFLSSPMKFECSLTRRTEPSGTRSHRVSAAGTAVVAESMSLSEKFAELKKKGEVALIPFIVAGDPDLETTRKALLSLDANGADIIELGVPYSDPLADGPVIQAAATRALANKVDLNAVLELLSEVSPHLSTPVVVFAYYNPIMKRGPAEFMRIAKAAGAAGLVVPDIPLEETPPLRALASAHGLELVLLTTPTTPVERMSAIAEASQGFLYLVSLVGVTGVREAVEGRVEKLLHDIKKNTEKPVAVGFGISTAAQAAQMASWGADGVIVGSALVKALASSNSSEEGLEALSKLTRSLRSGIPRSGQ